MKIVFFGTPEFVVPILKSLHTTYNRGREQQLIAVVTQEPKVTGRDKKITRSAVDNFAYKHKIEVIFNLEDVPQADLGIVAAYGNLIPQEVINRFSKGILNIHPSLLPHYRGASPIQAAITAGDIITGISIIKMDSQLDHGPVVSSFKEPIFPTDTNETLRNRLFEKTAEFLIDLIPSYLNGKVQINPQAHTKATFTRLIKKDDGFIPAKFIDLAVKGRLPKELLAVEFIKDFEAIPNANFIERLSRALYPWPGIWTLISFNSLQLRLQIHACHVENHQLILDEVQMEGKNKVTWEQFQAGYPAAKL